MKDTQITGNLMQLPTITVLTPDAFAAVVPMENNIFLGAEAIRTPSNVGGMHITRTLVVSSFDAEGRPVRYSHVLYEGLEVFLYNPHKDTKDAIDKQRAEVQAFIDDLTARGYRHPLDGVIGYPR